ncbi:MAG: hypothetical protein ACPL7K_08015 [Armatimonadota bacterium]
MAIRKILFAVAGIIVLLGASQLVFAGWWVERVLGIVESSLFYLWGLPGLLFGVVLLIGIMDRAVGLRLFLAAVAVISIVVGGVLLAQPEFARDVLGTLFVKRSPAAQKFDLLLGGLVRIAVGAILFYALMTPEGSRPDSGERAAQPDDAAREP